MLPPGTKSLIHVRCPLCTAIHTPLTQPGDKAGWAVKLNEFKFYEFNSFTSFAEKVFVSFGTNIQFAGNINAKMYDVVY